MTSFISHWYPLKLRIYSHELSTFPRDIMMFNNHYCYIHHMQKKHINIQYNVPVTSWPIIDTLQNNDQFWQLVNVDHPIPKTKKGVVSTHPVDWPSYYNLSICATVKTWYWFLGHQYRGYRSSRLPIASHSGSSLLAKKKMDYINISICICISIYSRILRLSIYIFIYIHRIYTYMGGVQIRWACQQ